MKAIKFKSFFSFSVLILILTLGSSVSFAQISIPKYFSEGLENVDTIVISTKRTYEEKPLKVWIAGLFFGDGAEMLSPESVTKMTADIFRSQITSKEAKIVESAFVDPKEVLGGGDAYKNKLFVYFNYKYSYSRQPFSVSSGPGSRDHVRVIISALQASDLKWVAKPGDTNWRSRIERDNIPGYVGTSAITVNNHKLIQEDLEKNLQKVLPELLAAINCGLEAN